MLILDIFSVAATAAHLSDLRMRENPIRSRIRARSINKSVTIRRKTNVPFATHQQIDLDSGLAPVAQPLAASCP